LKFLVDNNLPPSIARALHVLSSHADLPRIEVVALRDKFPANTKDPDWVSQLADEGGWSILSGDHFRKTVAERELIRRIGFNVFVLQSSWDSHTYWDKSAQLILWWPRIVDYASISSKVAVKVPWLLRGKFEQIKL
jgi:hypothetical protein